MHFFSTSNSLHAQLIRANATFEGEKLEFCDKMTRFIKKNHICRLLQNIILKAKASYMQQKSQKKQ